MFPFVGGQEPPIDMGSPCSWPSELWRGNAVREWQISRTMEATSSDSLDDLEPVWKSRGRIVHLGEERDLLAVDFYGGKGQVGATQQGELKTLW